MAELTGLPTPRMDWQAQDPIQAFKKFKALCELMFTGPLKGLDEEIKVKYLQIWSGEEGIELVSTWHITAAEAKKLDTYWTKFKEYLSPKSNFRLSRFKLRSLKQGSNEPVDSFVKKIRILVKECRYNNEEDHMIDALIFGTNSQYVQSKLLQKDEKLKLDEALDVARTAEATQQQLSDITAATPLQAHAMSTHTRRAPPKPLKPCNKCGREHARKPHTACPAHGTKCTACGKLNHWASLCRSSKQPQSNTNAYTNDKQKPRPQQRRVHTVNTTSATYMPEIETDEPVVDTLYFDALEEKGKTSKQPLISLKVASSQVSKLIKCKVDTGADGNVLPIALYKEMFPNESRDNLQASDITIEAYGGHKVKHYGNCKLQILHDNAVMTDSFHVAQADGPIIIGCPLAEALELVTINFVHNIDSKPVEHFEEFKDCFEGIGCFPGEYRITVNPDVPPVVHPPRRVPVALQDKLKKELDTLVSQQIIAPVTKPTDWVNSIVCVTKPNGSIRMCLDPKDLNTAIKRPHYVTPTLENILPKLKDAKFFTILDARSGYWNIKLSTESSYYTTFNTPHGRYRFLRLPFGLNCAQDIFQRKVDETFGDLPGVTGIADDIVIFGTESDGSDHDENLLRVLKRARETGIRFNPEKTKLKRTSIPFFGNIISAAGLTPDPAKIAAIQAMKPPADQKELQTFLGLATYLSRFTPKLSELSAPLRELCRKDVIFSWEKGHQEAFNTLKSVLVSPPVLRYFDNAKPVTIQVDASLKGLGAALLQDNGPIEYASKSLSDAETRYSNIEREMLGVLFGLERFHYYAYGRPVTVETDHKPLEAIFKKHLDKAPPRISRMLLRIQKYDVTITYVPGKDISLADALSRINPRPGKEIKDLNISVHEIHAHLNVSPMRLQKVREETATDRTLQTLIRTITRGWPDKRSQCLPDLIDYWNYRDELSVEDGIVLKGTRIFVPQSLQQEALQQLHYAHQGAEKCKMRARGSIFWANMNHDIDNMVKSCTACQAHSSANQKEPLIPHDVPKRPWIKLGCDLFYFENNTYLLLADYGSKFPIVRKLSSTSSRAVIDHLKLIFSEHGIPETLISDNGPQYSSDEFKTFANQFGFEHITSSPLYPQSNGFIERMVQTVKNIMKKCSETHSDLSMALLCLRTTPVSNDIPSPCVLLNNRMYKTNIPSLPTARKIAWDSDINTALQKRQDIQKHYHDRSAKELVPLVPDQPVRVLDPQAKQWSPGTIARSTDQPRSYNVTSNGTTYRRNRRHLKPVPTSGDPTDPQPTVECVPPSEQNLHVDPDPPASSENIAPVLRRSTRTIVGPERLISQM